MPTVGGIPPVIEKQIREIGQDHTVGLFIKSMDDREQEKAAEEENKTPFLKPTKENWRYRTNKAGVRREGTHVMMVCRDRGKFAEKPSKQLASRFGIKTARDLFK